ncbi:MAG: D-2-hydroxyacid dehydrogenase [Planctomycetia bacterium]|nr:D-2-hydroxyacid dehydrogenase [Planctomycetia bacterium]
MNPHKIILPDGYSLNPGDLDYSPLAEFGELTVYPRSTHQEMLIRAQDADILIGNKIILQEADFTVLPRLKYIGLQATGYNLIDVHAASRHGVTVTNVPAYSTDAVVQNTLAHLLNISFHLSQHSADIRNGRWTRSPDFSYWDYPLMELAGKTLGLIGFGNIAQGVARAALAFRMNVVACRSKPVKNNFLVLNNLPGGGEVQIPALSDADEICRMSDIISLHCPLNFQTKKLISRRRIQLMRPGAVLINTARGGLIDEQALADALNSGKLAGAGLDVLSSEPPTEDNPLLKAKNCFITPHLAWATRESRKRCLEVVVENVRAFLTGAPQNVVSPTP